MRGNDKYFGTTFKQHFFYFGGRFSASFWKLWTSFLKIWSLLVTALTKIHVDQYILPLNIRIVSSGDTVNREILDN